MHNICVHYISNRFINKVQKLRIMNIDFKMLFLTAGAVVIGMIAYDKGVKPMLEGSSEAI